MYDRGGMSIENYGAVAGNPKNREPVTCWMYITGNEIP